MKILIIEDDEYKAKQLIDFLKSKYDNENLNLCIKGAFQSGMDAISKNNYDIILLDMSMHSFEENTQQRSAGRHRPYGGREILNEMKRKNLFIPTIVVTQFSIFGEGDERLDAIQLDKLLNRDYSEMYFGMIHYNASILNWKDKLYDTIEIVRGRAEND